MTQDNNTSDYSEDHHHVGVGVGVRVVRGGEEGHGHQRRAPSDDDVLQLTLSCGSYSSTSSSTSDEASAARTPPRRRRRRRGQEEEEAFACRTCGRQFATFQALGGHRTSHLRPRRPTTWKPTTKAHACATCGLRFSTGQALGGHMRRHRGVGLPAAADQDCGPCDGYVDLARSTDRPSSAPLHLLNLFV